MLIIHSILTAIRIKGELISAGEYKIGLKDKHGDRLYYTVAENANITLNGKRQHQTAFRPYRGRRSY